MKTIKHNGFEHKVLTKIGNNVEFVCYQTGVRKWVKIKQNETTSNSC